VKNAELSHCNLFSDEVDVELDVLGSTMMHGVLRHVDGRHIVAVRNGGFGNVDVELVEEMPDPGALGDGVRDSAVLGLGAGAGHRRLALGRPRHERITDEDAKA
jgi:hypothetical protein